MIYNKDFREVIKDLDKENTLIIIDPPYNVGWQYDTYKDNLSKEDYSSLFAYFQGYKLVVIHYIEEIIEYIVPYMGVPTKVIQWIYNSQMPRQHRSIAFFNCKPDLSKVKQPYKNLTDKRILQNIKKTTADDELIFDAFMGTGTTLAVASKLGYKYMGCDISKKAYKITENRLKKIENNLFNQPS